MNIIHDKFVIFIIIVFKAFQEMDENQDGQITQEEFIEVCDKYSHRHPRYKSPSQASFHGLVGHEEQKKTNIEEKITKHLKDQLGPPIGHFFGPKEVS